MGLQRVTQLADLGLSPLCIHGSSEGIAILAVSSETLRLLKIGETPILTKYRFSFLFTVKDRIRHLVLTLFCRLGEREYDSKTPVLPRVADQPLR